MVLIETRRIDTKKVREMCIRENLYTCGTVEEYCQMFQKCDLGFRIIEIAQDILEHSNKERLINQSGNTKKEVLENICYSLINDCCYTCVDIPELAEEI